MNIKLMEAFSSSMSDYIGKENWNNMVEYLSGFDYFDRGDESKNGINTTFFNFPDDEAAFKVTKAIIEDAKVAVERGAHSPAIDYLLFRCAGNINKSFDGFNRLRNSTNQRDNDITGTGYDDFIGYISEAYIILAGQDGVIANFPVDKMSYGDLANMVSFRLWDELRNSNRKLLAAEYNNGVNYDGVRSKSVVKYNKDTDTWTDIKSGREVSEEEAKDLQARANIRRQGRAASLEGTDATDYDDDSGAGSSMDKLVAEYGKESGDNLGEFEDQVIEELDDGSELLSNWEDCCLDTEWEKKNNIKARILKTLLNDMVEDNIPDQKTFIAKCNINKQTFRNYMGLTDAETYPGVTIPMILDDYEVDIAELVRYLKDNPGKKDAMLSMLPGEKLHEALKRYVGKRIREARKLAKANRLSESTNNMVALSEDVKPYYNSFKTTIAEAMTYLDWSESSVSDVKAFLESNLKDGVDAHKNTWKFMAGAIDVGMNKFQKKMVCEALK